MPRADRLFALVQLLDGPARRGLDELARKLETSPRSIYRDLADLEARGTPIDREGGRYRLVEGAAMRSVPLTARERFLLTLALENPNLERQTAFRGPLRQLRNKIAARREAGAAAVLAGPERSGVVSDAIIEAVEQGIAASHSISFFYSSLSSGKRAWRGIDPWVLVHRSGAWYLIGRCHVHDDPRTFRLDRITAVLPIGQSFVRPRDFDPERWFANSWDVSSSSEVSDVRIVFDAAVAPLIEHALHHPSETKSRREDGSLDYRVRIGPLDELARWVVGFGGKAVAMAPSDLVDRVRALAEGAAEMHRAQGGRVGRAAAMVRRERK